MWMGAQAEILPGALATHYCQPRFIGTSYWASLVAQIVKNLPAMQETRVQSLGWEDLLEKGMATHSSFLAWRIAMDKGACWATVHGVQRVGD